MTYEVIVVVRLMYVAHKKRWTDMSLRNLTRDWLWQVEERFAGVNAGTQLSLLQFFQGLDDSPTPFVKYDGIRNYR